MTQAWSASPRSRSCVREMSPKGTFRSRPPPAIGRGRSATDERSAGQPASHTRINVDRAPGRLPTLARKWPLASKALKRLTKSERPTRKNLAPTLPHRAAPRVKCFLQMWLGGRLSGIVALVAMAGCGKWVDKLACSGEGCVWTREEWSRVQSLAGLPDLEPPPDPSNKYFLLLGAAELGRKLYFDTRLSGTASWVDTLGRYAPSFRTDKRGDPVNISCATCHDPARYGSDFTSMPGNVSIGAGWYDVNAQQTLNAAFFSVLYWNGRTDALWAQAAQVIESGVSMNGDRLNTFWVVANAYRDDYTSVFCPDSDPAPEGCLPPPQDLTTDCHVTPECFPLHGKPVPGKTTPFDDMTVDNQRRVTRVLANVGKAIAAYERLLKSGESAFDRFVRDGSGSTELTPAAQRGLKLFIGRASCIDCHNTPLLSDQKFHNIDIPQIGAGVPTETICTGTASAPACDCTEANGGIADETCSPWGAYAGLDKALHQEFCRQSRYSDSSSAADDGAVPFCGFRGGGQVGAPDGGQDGGPAAGHEAEEPDNDLKGTWRTPSLRDVAMTAPYMHDGVFATLAEVVWHYDQGQGAELAPLNLSGSDRDDLVAFLESLTGKPGLTPITAPPDLPARDGGTPPPDAEADTSLTSTSDAGGGDDH